MKNEISFLDEYVFFLEEKVHHYEKEYNFNQDFSQLITKLHNNLKSNDMGMATNLLDASVLPIKIKIFFLNLFLKKYAYNFIS